MQETRKKIIYFLAAIFVLFVVFEAGAFVGRKQVVCPVCKPENLDFSLFWEAHQKLSESFIGAEEIDEKQILYGAIAGMAQSFGDPYTDFFSPDQAKIFKEDLTGSFGGVGIEVGIRNGRITVISPLKGTPAEKAGLKPGDEIVGINGEDAFDISIEKAVSLIRGQRGTKVTLSIMREGWTQPRDFEITRDTIKIPTMEWEIKDENIAYVRIYQFDQSLLSNFRNASFSILNSGAEKIILDLRSNPGGYLEVSKEIAGWFLKPGEIVAVEDFGKLRERREYKADGNGMFSEWPMVILINQGTASASEILAGSLRDNRGINLIGEKSFGKGSVQELIDLSDKLSFLKVTVSKWFTPKGTSISETGLNPDIIIDITENDLINDKDPQLEKALEIIKSLE